MLPLFKTQRRSLARRRCLSRSRRRTASGEATPALGHTRTLREAAEQAGIPRVDDFNTGDNTGSGKFEVTAALWRALECGEGISASCVKRPNLRIVTGALIDRLTFTGSRVTGIEFSLGGESLHASARIETLLAAAPLARPRFCSAPASVMPGT